MGVRLWDLILDLGIQALRLGPCIRDRQKCDAGVVISDLGFGIFELRLLDCRSCGSPSNFQTPQHVLPTQIAKEIWNTILMGELLAHGEGPGSQIQGRRFPGEGGAASPEKADPTRC